MQISAFAKHLQKCFRQVRNRNTPQNRAPSSDLSNRVASRRSTSWCDDLDACSSRIVAPLTQNPDHRNAIGIADGREERAD